MPITKKDKTLDKNLITLEYNNAKKVSWQRWNVYAVSTTRYKSYGLLGGSTIVSAAEDDAAPARLIPLILFVNWSYRKKAEQKNNICTLYLII